MAFHRGTGTVRHREASDADLPTAVAMVRHHVLVGARCIVRSVRDWASTLDWPDKLPLAEMTPAHRATVRSCPQRILKEIEAEAHRRQLAMAGRMSSGQSSSIPEAEVAAYFRLRTFLIARQVVETVDQMWATMTPNDWTWLRSPRDATGFGGYGVETPEAAQVLFGAIALEWATAYAAESLGDPTAPQSQILGLSPIDLLLRAFTPLRKELAKPGSAKRGAAGELLRATRLSEGPLGEGLRQSNDRERLGL